MDFQLSERQVELASEVREFVRGHCFRQRARQAEEAKEYREELWEKVVEKGWTCLTIPKKYGGSGEANRTVHFDIN
ncbi:MAG: acyl-CoA dehydrogenase family protein [Desulfobacteraceae bacterium]|nr:MAG: acyl-CoA dehydrogenase family protein [Desulfobacteraceae bacterium]